MKVPYLDLPAQHSAIEDEILDAVSGILRSGQFILGEPVATFEERFAEMCGTSYAIGVSDGTDALILSLKALGVAEGDEVITVSNSYLATGNSIALAGGKPVFVDVLDDLTMDPKALEAAIGPQTKAIIPVHLTGLPAKMDAIGEVAEEHGIPIVEDAAQAVRAEFQGKRVGGFGKTGCFSLHPLKNLNACGDGGVITTDDPELYEHLKMARNHGLKDRDECAFISANSRLDALQAEILKVKMKHLPDMEARRREIAGLYQKRLSDLVKVPEEGGDRKCVYHTFVTQCEQRDDLKAYLSDQGIDTKIHYPIPIHLQPPMKNFGYGEGDLPITESQAQKILSLPIYPELKDEQIEYICESIKRFYHG